MKIIVGSVYGSYTFNAAAKTVTLSGLETTIPFESILEITNVTRKTVIYLAEGGNGLGGTLTGNTLTLDYNTTTHSNTDKLRIIYDYSDALIESANITNKFREAFETYSPSGGKWSEVKDSNDIIMVDGNTAGASYLVISKDPLTADSTSSISTVNTFNFPVDLSIGACRSQAVLGTEFSLELVDTNPPAVSASDLTIQQIQQTTTTLTISTTTDHGLVPGKRIQIYNCAEPRFNYPALVVASISASNIFTATAGPGGTIPSLTVGPSASGMVAFRSALGYAQNGTSMIFENGTATNASVYIRSESGDSVPSGTIIGNHAVTVGTTAPIALVTAANTYSWSPTTEYRLSAMVDRIQWSDVGVDSTAQSTSRLNKTQVVPSITPEYKFRIRATNNKSLTVPVAKIVSIVKSGTTTWTVTTESNHNLTTFDYINIYGNRDTVNFPNLTTATLISGINSPTQFTVISTTGTATSYGGTVYRINGGNLPSALGAISMVVQTITRVSNVVTLTASATITGVSIGDYINLHGCRENTAGNDLFLDGPYKVANLVTSTATLIPIGNAPTGADIGLTNCSGTIIRRTDLRISYVRVLDYERLRIEPLPRPTSDLASAFPVSVNNNLTIGTVSATNISTNIAQIGGNTVTTAGANGVLAIGGNIATGSAPTTNPTYCGALDTNGFTRPFRTDPAGGLTGPNEILYPGFTFTAGNAVPVEATNSKTVVAIAGRDCELELGITSQGNAANTIQVEGSWDNNIYNVIPMSRIDNFASAQTYAYLATWTPQNNSTFKGRTYGYPYIRIHQTALTTTGTTVGVIRIIPIREQAPGEIMSAFTLDAQNTTETIGTSGGVLMSGGVRTLPVNTKGAAKLILDIDAFTYATAVPTSSTLIVEDLQGGVWSALPLTPFSGGATVTSITGLGNLNLPLSGRWEADVTGMTSVRVRWSAYTAGSATLAKYHGVLRIIPVPGTTAYKPTYQYSQSGISAISGANVLAIESGAAKATTIKRLTVTSGTATAAVISQLTLQRETSAGATNSVTIDNTFNRDPGDTNFSGIVRSNNLTPGATVTTKQSWDIPVPATGTLPTVTVIDLTNNGQEKGIVVPPGTANGANFVFGGTAGGAGFGIRAEWTEE